MEAMNFIVDGAKSPSDCSVSSDSKSNNGSFTSKSRKPNWTDVEIRTLIMEYDKYRDVMRNKGGYGSDGQKKSPHSNEEKNKIWKRITAAVNRSKVDGVNMSGTAICERTVKEVIKKWVNLVNKTKSDVATHRRHPAIGMCFTSTAVNTILNTNDPLDISKNWSLPEPTTEFDMSNGYQTPADAVVKIEKPDEIEEYPNNKKYRRILPNTLRSVILKRVNDVELPAEYQNETTASPSVTKRARTEPAPVFNGAEHINNSIDEQDTAEETNFPPFYNAEYETDNFMKLNKEVLELKKKKLMIKIDKLLIERARAENDRDRSKVEKETAILAQEKVKLELEMLKKSAQT